MATTIMPGISAAIVINGISKISGMIAQADAAMQRNIGHEINAALRAIPTSPDASKVGFKEQASAVRSALGDANLEGKNPNIDRMPLFLENVIGSFFEDYIGKLDALFPGLGMAGADADAFVRAALTSAVGMSYNEVVDSTQAHTAFLMAQRQTFAKEREALDTAAGAGHRFAPGQVLEAIARARGAGVASATEALTQAHAQRLEQERNEKMRLARASLDASMDRVKRLHQQVAEAFRLKLRARGMWINDQNAVVDAANNIIALNERFNSQVSELMRRTAVRRCGLTFDDAAARARDDFLGKLKMANANEVVDLFGNAVTTLMNQVQGKGAYNGLERDVTDWDSLLA